MTRVELLGADGQIAGLFFTGLPPELCKARTLAIEFIDDAGSWVPAGGVDLRDNEWWWTSLKVGEVFEVNPTGEVISDG